MRVRRKRRFQGVSEPSFRLEIHGSAGCSLSDIPADSWFLGGLVGAETCCQTVQKVGEVPRRIIRPEIVEAVGGGQVTVRRSRRF